jgi:hypothetical protein
MGHIWVREDVRAGFWWEKTSLGRPRHRWKSNIKISKRNLLGRGGWTGLVWLGIGISGGLLCMQE